MGKDEDMDKLFGTDGIRGVANKSPLVPETVAEIGKAIVSALSESNSITKVVIGKDTRVSGQMIEYAIASGISAMGADVYLAGILPTPGVAYLTAAMNADAGVVISASHNPFGDNGIKVFDGQGCKLSEKMESEIEQKFFQKSYASGAGPAEDIGRMFVLEDAPQKYKDRLRSILSPKTSLRDLRMVLDCSNGATYRVAPVLFAELGADVTAIGNDPDGKNINANCGSEHPQILAKHVIQKKADMGLAFDGDGDRLIAVDEKGQILSGDRILAICANSLKQRGKLRGNIVVSTEMSNLGLRMALQRMGIEHVMTEVGDRHVLAQMLACGAVIGGEDSGHMIFLDHHTTGDGIIGALMLMEIMQMSSRPLSELSNIMAVYPQKLINVEVQSKPELKSVPRIKDAILAVETSLGEAGRVLVRYSGTQPLCRVMVEGPDEKTTQKYCRQIADVVQNALGAH
jgi:phosphoglucosamine mutase